MHRLLGTVLFLVACVSPPQEGGSGPGRTPGGHSPAADSGVEVRGSPAAVVRHWLAVRFEMEGGEPVALADGEVLEWGPVEVFGLCRAGLAESVDGAPTVIVELTQADRERFHRRTGENVDQRMAVMARGEVVVAPRIMEPLGATCALAGLKGDPEEFVRALEGPAPDPPRADR